MNPDSLDYAITRFSVVFRQWEDHAAGSGPHLPAFLAGWFCSASGVPMPVEVGTFRESFRTGFAEQRSAATIDAQRKGMRVGLRS